MRLHEYQAKAILEKHGIKIPRGKIAKSPEEVEQIARELGKVVVKAQVLVGGRGKAGGIKKAENPEDAKRIASNLIGCILKGHRVEKVLVEEALDIEAEMYVGFTVDRVSKKIAAILSTMGGMDIEEIAKNYPEKIATQLIDPRWGLYDYNIRNLLTEAKVPKELWGELSFIISKLYEIMIKYEAELVEINPLAVTKKGLIAADARLNVDDNALFRHQDIAALAEFTEENVLEREAINLGLNYVHIGGDVGIMANGAGMAMATMDLIKLMGGRPANFLDIGGGASREEVKKAFEILLKSNVKSIFVNIFGGITRCDEVAHGIVDVLKNLDIKIPIVIRLAGTNEEEGRRILESSGLKIYVVREMEEGAKLAVDLAR